MTGHPANGGDLLAAGAVGMTFGQTVLSVAQAVPGTVYSTVFSGLIGLAVVWLRTRYEATAENKYLKKRNRELEAEIRVYQANFKLPPSS